jgi:hypothetical protein
MWENQVGRSRPFTEFMLPKLKDHFPENLGNLSYDEFHAGANYPERTLIRVYADEVTYNLHGPPGWRAPARSRRAAHRGATALRRRRGGEGAGRGPSHRNRQR